MYMYVHFTLQGYTSDGRPVYEIPVDFLSFGLSEVFLFYDKDCDGKGRLPHRWFVSSTAPDLTKDDQLLVSVNLRL